MIQMIRSAVAQLTFYYVLIIMILSISFSIILFNVSTTELSRGLRKQPSIFFQDQIGTVSTYDQFRQARIDEIGISLRSSLLLFNLAVLFVGGGISYILAKRTLEPIENAIESQSRFTADAAHELRTPLTTMQTEIEVVLRDSNFTKAEAKELLESNLEEVRNLTALSNTLLKLAKSNDAPQELKSLSSDALYKNIKNRVKNLLALNNTKLTISSEKFTFDADGDTLTELFVILIDNAIKYGDTKKPIKLTATKKQKYVEFKLINSGKGINPKDLSHIFERFYRSDLSRSKLNVQGYGLGLALAKQIVEMHHGHISAQSIAEKETVFTIKIPPTK